jgi:serine/threonine protein kinase
MTQNFPDLGKYRVLEVLGQGRFATVYKVEDTTMGRLAAAKVFDAQLFQDELWIQHLQDKIRPSHAWNTHTSFTSKKSATSGHNSIM